MSTSNTQSSSRKSLFEILQGIAKEVDWRKARGKRHPLEYILFLYLLGQILGIVSYRGIVKYFSDPNVLEALRPFITFEHGIPSPAMFSRTFSTISHACMVPEICDWILQLLPPSPDGRPHLAIDGKALRAAINKALHGSGLYIVNVFNVSLNIMVYMMRVGRKTNEASAIENEIRSILYNEHAIVTMDAMGTHSAILQQIVDVGSDYIAPVKANQKSLMEGIESYIVNLVLSMSDVVDNHVDLNGHSEEEAPGRVIENTRCHIVDEDNSSAGDYASSEEKTDNADPSSNLEATESNPDTVLPVPDVDPNLTSTDSSMDSDNHSSAESAETKVLDERKETTRGFKFFDDAFHYVDLSSFDPETLDPNNKTLVYFKVGNRLIPMASSHGRFERREYQYVTLTPAMKLELLKDLDSDEWRSIQSICLCTRYRAVLKRDAKTKQLYYDLTITRTPYILSYQADAKSAGYEIRRHWAVEVFHHCLDSVFKEDQCTVRSGCGPENVSFFKKLAYNIIRVCYGKDDTGDVTNIEAIQNSFKVTGFSRIVNMIMNPWNPTASA